jgi:hypothetical protein
MTDAEKAERVADPFVAEHAVGGDELADQGGEIAHGSPPFQKRLMASIERRTGKVSPSSDCGHDTATSRWNST